MSWLLFNLKRTTMKATQTSQIAGKIGYSLTFMVALPAFLWWWAILMEPVVSLPAIHIPEAGLVILLSGAGLLLAGMYALWSIGGGLPMNAFPPPRFVQEGVFAYLPHPIYTGFVLICWGVFLYAGSAAGFWLVSPVAAAGCAALVWGYENPDLRERFPEAVRQFRFGIPPDELLPPGWYHRVSALVVVVFPMWFFHSLIGLATVDREWMALYWDIPTDLLSANRNPVLILGLIWVILSPFAARTRQQLRQIYLSSLISGGAMLYCSAIFPAAGSAHWLTGFLPPLESSAAIIFSISWFWLWLAAELYRKAYPAYQTAIFSVAAILTLLMLADSLFPMISFLAGFSALMLGLYYPLIWEYLRERAEIVANSWREWHFGPVRVINHGFYVGAASFLGMLVGGSLAGEAYVTGSVVFGVIGVVSAGLWGQFVEGSDKLKRPFGYYGSIAGILIAVFVLHWMGLDVWVMLALFSVFMPWVQGIGRLRCLVNGCCHGAPTNDRLGIRYFHPRSRVCFLSHLKGKPLHPTPLYSLLWLALVGGFQLRLWNGGAAPAFIFAMYLILNGLGRFVEEAYRGEPQTPVFAGLRLYQWAAIVSVLGGIILSTIPTAWPAMNPGLTWTSVGWGAAMWVFVQFLMGIDFPNSTKRFSRLT